jgi:hypothetical protein
MKNRADGRDPEAFKRHIEAKAAQEQPTVTNSTPGSVVLGTFDTVSSPYSDNGASRGQAQDFPDYRPRIMVMDDPERMERLRGVKELTGADRKKLPSSMKDYVVVEWPQEEPARECEHLTGGRKALSGVIQPPRSTYIPPFLKMERPRSVIVPEKALTRKDWVARQAAGSEMRARIAEMEKSQPSRLETAWKSLVGSVEREVRHAKRAAWNVKQRVEQHLHPKS